MSVPLQEKKRPEKSGHEGRAKALVPRQESKPVPDSPTPSPSSISGVLVPGLGSGALEGAEKEEREPEKRERKTREPRKKPVIEKESDESEEAEEAPRRREKGEGREKRELKKRREVGKEEESESEEEQATSAALLAKMATPQVFEGPEIELVKAIADQLETSIARLDKEHTADRWIAKREAKTAKIRERFEAAQKAGLVQGDSALVAQAVEERDRAQAALPMTKYAIDNALYVGSIVLKKIPSTPKKEADLLKTADLVFDPYHSFPMQGSAVELPKDAKVGRQLARLVLLTMIHAGQFDYLRRSGIVGGDWKVVVEVHYYRSRKKAMTGLHKDTYGQTLFVNLNFTNERPVPGPEWIVNPPLVGSHEERIEEQLPPQFMADLKKTRRTTPTTIDTETLPPYSVVSFVDEAIHHTTPLLGHREVTAANLRQWLRTDPEFEGEYEAAKQAFDDAKSTTSTEPLASEQRPFEKGFEGTTEKREETKEAKSWQVLMTLCDGAGGVKLTRPQLRTAGMTNRQIDRLLSEVGETFSTVKIPKLARKDKREISETMVAPGQPKPITLQRTMSQLALKGQLPVDPGDVRRFFRTWVRAVRTKPAPSKPAPTKKRKKQKKDED